MGHILDRAIDAVRADDIAATAAAMGEAPVYRDFVVVIRRGRDVRELFTVQGVDSCSVSADNMHRCMDGEVLEVRPRRRGFFTEQELQEADVLNATDKARKAVARDVRAGVEIQAQMWRDNGVI